jgi:hypothetical protein
MINFTDIIKYLKELIFGKEDVKEDQYYHWKDDEDSTLEHNLTVFEENIDYFIEYKKEYNEVYFKILKKVLPPLVVNKSRTRVCFIEYRINKEFSAKSVFWYSNFIHIVETCLMRYIDHDFEDHKDYLRKYNSDMVTVLIEISFKTEEDWTAENFKLYTKNIKAHRFINEKSRIIYEAYKEYLTVEERYDIKSVDLVIVKFV